MLLTEAQVRAIQKIIEDHHNAFIINTIGPDAVARDVLDELKKKGLVAPALATIKDSYLFGQVLAAMNNPAVQKMSFEEFQKWVQKNPIPLGPIEQHAVQMAQLQAATYVKGLGNRISASTGQVLIEADAALRAKTEATIRDETAANLAKRETVKQLKSKLGWSAGDWARDWDRIAITEKHNAMQAGVADNIQKKHGSDSFVAKRPMPDACEHCKRLHLGPDGQPRIFKLSVLQGFGTNHGRKVKDWQPTVGAVHPHCQCQLVRVPAGWGFDKEGDLVPGGKLGVRYESEEGTEKALQAEMDLRKSLAAGESHLDFQGLAIVVENTVGSVRRWKNAEGGVGETHMLFAYGYIEGAQGDDGDELDCYIGPDPIAPMAYVVHQQNPDNGIYDEAKVMLGFANAGDAEAAYRAHYDRPDFLVSVSPMDMAAFKRWAFAGQPVQKSLAAGPRLVILEKAEPTQEQLAEASQADARSPSPSGMAGPNLFFRTPERAPPALVGKDTLDLGPQELLSHEVTRGALKRDPEVYTMLEPLLPPTTSLADEQAKSGVRSDDDRAETAKRNRTWLDQHERELSGEPNRAPIQKSEPKLVLIKSLGHKYLSKTWLHGHWVYEYAEQHGGKVVDHLTSPDHVVLKLPKHLSPELEKFKKVHGVSGKMFAGGQNVMLEIHKDEAGGKLKHPSKAITYHYGHLKKPAPAPAPAPAPVAPSAPVAPPSPAPAKPKKPAKTPAPVEPVKPLKAEEIKLLKALEEIPKESVAPPPTLPTFIPPGSKVQVGGKIGTLLGFTSGGELVYVTKEGERAKAHPSYAKVIAKAGHKSTVQKSKTAKVYKLDAKAQALMDQAAKLPVVKGKTMFDYTDKMRAQGAEVYIVGGAVRDLVRGVVQGLPDSEILASLKDIDITQTGTLQDSLKIIEQVVPHGNHAIMNNSAGWDTIQVHDKHPDSIGLDVNTMVHSGHELEDRVFDHDLDGDCHQRDFTMNTLYYDPYGKVVIDPSGFGLADAQSNVLRLDPGMSEDDQHVQDNIPFRYIKFRDRGAQPEAETLKRIQKQVKEQFKDFTPSKWKSLFNRTFLKKGKTVAEAMKIMETVMKSDGMEAEFQKYVKPQKAMLEAYASTLKGVGHGH